MKSAILLAVALSPLSSHPFSHVANIYRPVCWVPGILVGTKTEYFKEYNDVKIGNSVYFSYFFSYFQTKLLICRRAHRIHERHVTFPHFVLLMLLNNNCTTKRNFNIGDTKHKHRAEKAQAPMLSYSSIFIVPHDASELVGLDYQDDSRVTCGSFGLIHNSSIPNIDHIGQFLFVIIRSNQSICTNKRVRC